MAKQNRETYRENRSDKERERDIETYRENEK